MESGSNATTALSITANVAAGALLAKVAALLASGGTLPATLLPHLAIHKSTEKEYHSTSALKGSLAGKVAVASAPAPAARSHASALALPAEWLVVTSAAEWFDQHRQASAAGALLATVFISDAAALAHSPLLERLRRNFGAGPDAPVRFVFVHIEDDFQRRHSACAAAAATSALARGTGSLTLGRVSHTAALHGLDVALTSFLPDGVRAFPSLLLTAGPAGGSAAASSAPWSWSAATRVGELTQLVSDWAFIIQEERRRRQPLQSEQRQAAEEEKVAVEEEAEVAAGMKRELRRAPPAVAAAASVSRVLVGA
ncbi:hypothetical protein PLESTB_000441000 [Pleodorina starrii]|uniref:Uncharacterized protein n=1 Tax=Pleodorina starrii TaxID=330485 RepID=A0A9W6BF28_9CHLO|nr:hypothetical protein PLESTB_000441000 [Pleodorina starrii]